MSANIPGCGAYKCTGATCRPFTTILPEMFEIVDDNIVLIEAAMMALPFGSKSR